MNDVTLFRWLGRFLRLISIIAGGLCFYTLFTDQLLASVCFGVALMLSFYLEVANWRRLVAAEEDSLQE